MLRGAEAALDVAGVAIAAGSGAGTLLKRAGDAWSTAGGGTSGMLWGVLLAGVGDVLGDELEVTPQLMSEAVRNAAGEVQRVGSAEVGDKSMVDALIPFVDTFRESADAGDAVGVAWRLAAEAATAAAEGTADLLPKVGRARPLAKQSLGSPDAGAISLALILTAVGDTIIDKKVIEKREVGS